MIVKKFYADSTREALRQVRDALGAEALILSNRQVAGGGIEIMAVAEMDVVPAGASAAAAEPAAAASAPQAAPAAPDLAAEMRLLRSMVEGQLAGFAWGDIQRREPVKIEILRQCLSAGFSPALSRKLLDDLPAGCDFGKGMKWMRAELLSRLRVIAPGNDIIERGGVYALVGPTGVGKTTTVAKLAARCTLQHGATRVALLTTDSYRIGAYDQLRIYGKILGVPVYAVKDEADLQLILSDLQSRHLVLIDTVGTSQRDRRLADQAALLHGQGRRVQRLLLLAAVSQGHTLEDVVRCYRGGGLAGCVLTKVDEALSLGSALDVVMRHDLPLHYVTNGQRVPEDLHLPNAMYLLDRAFRFSPDGSPFAPAEEEFPLLMTAAPEVHLEQERG